MKYCCKFCRKKKSVKLGGYLFMDGCVCVITWWLHYSRDCLQMFPKYLKLSFGNGGSGWWWTGRSQGFRNSFRIFDIKKQLACSMLWNFEVYSVHKISNCLMYSETAFLLEQGMLTNRYFFCWSNAGPKIILEQIKISFSVK